MITVKKWNSFTRRTRIEIASIAYGYDILSSRWSALADEYHHYFDHDEIGAALQSLLKLLYMRKDGSVLVQTFVRPDYHTCDKVRSQVPKNVKKAVSYTQLAQRTGKKHWQVTYKDADDITHVHVYAYTKEEAKQQVMEECWDCDEIIDIYELKD